MELLEQGSVTSVPGFKAAGIAVGIKKSGKKDLALIVSETPAVAALALTQNRFRAAPVDLCFDYLRRRPFHRALIINSGNANACTGDEGMENAQKMTAQTASLLGIEADEVFVASTGVIGHQLDMNVMNAGIEKIIPELSSTGGMDAATAIRTTDTFEKSLAVRVEIEGVAVTIGGIAKGSGMIHPNMATMIGIITTDANIDKATLQTAFSDAVTNSFNMVSVDGDTSTNDSAFVLANQTAKHSLIDSTESENYRLFKEALDYVAKTLAKLMAKDGEGATKLIEAVIDHAGCDSSARLAAKSIVTSSLVKAAIFGEDGNWGRILSAVGNSGADFEPIDVKAWIETESGKVQIVDKGRGISFDEAVLDGLLKDKTIIIRVDLGAGEASATAWGCDLSYDYVKINADYRT